MVPNVLIVDDESTTRRLVQYVLKPLGVEVIGAANADEAAARVQSHPIHLVLMDVNLPGMDGFTLIGHLRTFPGMENVPVVIFTARNNPGDVARAREAGCADFLYKPFSTQALRTLVARELGLPQ